ncbi:MAG: sigma-54-dependent Fis family transcriptional regulator, partial [Candidatus Cloacimonetes bacterium]|nr:sigma-54-dependent Fis family transcriptional regulator [Candidatus Cloacimonadota bacterium]
ASGKAALNYLKSKQADIIILDYLLPDIDGLSVLKILNEKYSQIPVIMLTAHGNIRHAVESMKSGAFNYLTKPFDNNELISVINKAMDQDKLTDEFKSFRTSVSSNRKINDITTKSKAMQKVISQIELVMHNDITVLLEGETGTGKEWIARLIHKNSKRKHKPFIAIDCGAIPETLFESELFGYEKGAFTGASKMKTGKFELADEGILFLDEINNLPMSMQAKLLRVLEERVQVRLGGNNAIKLDLRIIVASNKCIHKDVKAGRFRKDLYYRLNEFKISIPALAQRTEDIPAIANFFLQKANQNYKKNMEGFTNDSLKALMKYKWPGNIRELRNVINRAVVIATGKFIGLKDLIFVDVDEFNPENNDFLLSSATEKTEIELLERALSLAKGNKTKAAQLVGLSIRQFYRKLQKYGIRY